MENDRSQVKNCKFLNKFNLNFAFLGQPCGYGVVNDQCADLANFQGREVVRIMV
jgi:hypothetical protein